MAEETVRNLTEEEKRKERDKGRQTDAVIIDLGRKAAKDVRALRKGRGKLLDNVQDCVDELRAAGELSATSQTVIVVVERKLTSRDGLVPFLVPPGLSAMFPLGAAADEDDEDDEDDDD